MKSEIGLDIMCGVFKFGGWGASRSPRGSIMTPAPTPFGFRRPELSTLRGWTSPEPRYPQELLQRYEKNLNVQRKLDLFFSWEAKFLKNTLKFGFCIEARASFRSEITMAVNRTMIHFYEIGNQF